MTLPMCANRKRGIVLTARCEVFRACLVEHDEDRITLPSEISKGVFVAGTLLRPTGGKVLVKFLDTRNEEVEISNFKPTVLLARECRIKEWLTIEKKDPVRVKRLLSEIKLDHLNTYEREAMRSICEKFSDIFHMKGDKLSGTRIYTQPIRLISDATPVYVKPCKLPYSQRERR
jgi:hypothetical protein